MSIWGGQDQLIKVTNKSYINVPTGKNKEYKINVPTDTEEEVK